MKKKLFIIVIFLISFSTIGQTIDTSQIMKSFDAPIGLSFGNSISQVKYTLAKRGGVIDITNSKKELLIYNQVKVGSKMSEMVQLSFVEDKLFNVVIVYKELEESVQYEFDQLKNTLDNKYGRSTYWRSIESPYKDGDGNEMLAIKTGKGSIYSFWKLKNGGITLGISKSLLIMLEYEDYELAYLNKKLKKAEDESDL